ncbi:MAG: hypothetical protein NT040_05845 [Bacteroidetes bacterium]|nr:hypothetical protein [Bacteroidota bacterium]
MKNHCNENMPSWAQRTDAWGRKHWDKAKPLKSRNGEYISAIIFNLVFLWIVNHIPGWNLGFIKDNFMVVLWILNVNILVQIGGNALMLLSGLPTIRYIVQIIIESASFVTQMVLFYIYPFDFSHFHGLFWLDWFLPIALIIGMVVSAIKVFSNLWKLIFRRS